jgi:UPF0755 protein
MKAIIGYWPLPVGLVIAAILMLIITAIFQTARTVSNGIVFILTKNETAHSVALRLKENGIIDNPAKFILWAKLLNYERKLKKGKYNLTQGIDELAALKILVESAKAEILVTIPEGKTMEQTANILEEHNICSKKDFLTQAQDKTFLTKIGIKGKSAEGYLFPDSYEFEISSEPKEVLTRMIKQFFSVFNSLQQMDSASYTYEEAKRKIALSDREVVILASIVEAEALLNAERPIIASVFLNRLKRRLPLQSCATVEYILKERKLRLSIQDLSIDSPYNTYLHPGLPPGPICNPGRNSIKAVLFPAKTDYLFFVSRGDGSHYFSKTGREHQAAIRRYQKSR